MAEAHDGASGETAGKAVAQQQDHSAPAPAIAVVRTDRIPNPGFPPERLRVTDLDPKKEKQAERTISALFFLSIVGSVLAAATTQTYDLTLRPFGTGSWAAGERAFTVGLGHDLAAGHSLRVYIEPIAAGVDVPNLWLRVT